MEDIPVYVKVKDLFCIMIHTLCQSALYVFLLVSWKLYLTHLFLINTKNSVLFFTEYVETPASARIEEVKAERIE